MELGIIKITFLSFRPKTPTGRGKIRVKAKYAVFQNSEILIGLGLHLQLLLWWLRHIPTTLGQSHPGWILVPGILIEEHLPVGVFDEMKPFCFIGLQLTSVLIVMHTIMDWGISKSIFIRSCGEIWQKSGCLDQKPLPVGVFWNSQVQDLQKR